MRHMYQLKSVKRTGVIALAVVASGCQGMGQGGYAGYPNPYPPYNYNYAGNAAQQPAAAQQASAPGFDVAAYKDLQSTNQNLKERLERVEKAMLRLDRRMQLVERNELNRMGGTQTSQGVYQQQAARNALNLSDDDNADTAGDYRPVSSRGESLASVMQVTPAGAPPPEPMRVASRNAVSNGLPSLADVDDSSSGRTLQPGKSSLAIWTVKYEPSKVWPERDQLPSSREVVEALREGEGVTITARGKNASSIEFRERVRALSRYLSKVSSLDSVPIAAMPAPQLDDQTIEILATY